MFSVACVKYLPMDGSRFFKTKLTHLFAVENSVLLHQLHEQASHFLATLKNDDDGDDEDDGDCDGVDDDDNGGDDDNGDDGDNDSVARVMISLMKTCADGSTLCT